MNINRILNILKLSFHSREFYKDIYYNLSGTKIFYLIVVLAITNLTFVVPIYNFFYHTLNQHSQNENSVEYILEQLPKMSFKGGLLSIEQESPFFVYSQENNKKIIVIDLKAQPEKYMQSQIPIFVSRRGVFTLVNEKFYQQILNFDNLFAKDTIITNEFFIDKVKLIKSQLFFLIFGLFYPMTVMFRATFIAINIFIFTLLGKFYGRITSNSLQIKSLYRVGVFAMLPPLVIDSILNIYFYITRSYFEGLQVILHSPIKMNAIFIISLSYFYFALKSCVKK